MTIVQTEVLYGATASGRHDGYGAIVVMVTVLEDFEGGNSSINAAGGYATITSASPSATIASVIGISGSTIRASAYYAEVV